MRSTEIRKLSEIKLCAQDYTHWCKFLAAHQLCHFKWANCVRMLRPSSNHTEWGRAPLCIRKKKFSGLFLGAWFNMATHLPAEVKLFAWLSYFGSCGCLGKTLRTISNKTFNKSVVVLLTGFSYLCPKFFSQWFGMFHKTS